MSDFSRTNSPDDNTVGAVKQTAQEKAGEGVGLVSDKATDIADTAKDRAGDVTGEAAARARDVAGELRSQLEDQAEAQTRRLAQGVRQLADDLGDMGENGKKDSPATNAVRQVADRGRDVAGKLEDRGPQGLASDLQDFARRRPGMFLAGAAVAGFATARLAKGVKSASDGATSNGYGEARGGRPASGGVGYRESAAVGDGGAHGAAESGDGYPSPGPTPSYGGPVSPPAPLPVRDRYSDPDGQRPQGG